MNSPERNVFFQAARSGRAGPPRSVFFHPDCTVGTGIAPVQLALADFLLTAGRGSHPALKTFYSVADSQYSTFFVKCNRFFRISAAIFGETIQSRCRGRRPRRPLRGQRGASETVGRMRSHLPCKGRRPDAPAGTPRFSIIRRANPQTPHEKRRKEFAPSAVPPYHKQARYRTSSSTQGFFTGFQFPSRK